MAETVRIDWQRGLIEADLRFIEFKRREAKAEFVRRMREQGFDYDDQPTQSRLALIDSEFDLVVRQVAGGLN